MTLSSATLPATETTPYVGLRPFLKEEALKFYGRGEHIFAMLEILKRRHYLAVVGSSGSGKSSLVRAGLLPALEDGHFDRAAQWRFVQMRPGRAPYENLLTELLLVVSPEDVVDADTIAARRVTLRSGPRGLLEVVADCLLPENTRVLVLVDQFEEIFRFLERGNWSAATDGRMSDHQRDTALAFVDMLLTTIAARDPRVLIVLTMRSDYLGECEAFLGLSAAISKAQFLTPRMTREELTDVIQCPIEAAGGSIDRAVVNELLNAVGSAQDTLPRLEHVLLRMWNLACAGRKGDAVKITEDQYRDPHCGGFENALDKHADEIFESLNDSSRRIAELLFRSLSERTAEGRLIRRLRTIREIAEIAHTDQTPVSPQSVIQVAQKFVRPGVNFLVPSPACSLMADTTLDVSHESLLRQWQRLGRWVDVESKAADDLRQLVRDAQRWERGDKGYLQPPELDLYEAWRAKSAPTASWAKRYVTLEQFQLAEHYLTASAADWKHRLETEAAGQRRLRWYLKLALTAAAAAGVATLVAVLAFFWALDQRNEAEKAVGSGWVHSLGHTEPDSPLNPIELNTLWDLARSENERIHEQFLVTGLRSSDDARHLRRRLEVAIQADVGLRDSRRDAIRHLLMAKLRDPMTDSLSQRVCVDIGLVLRLADSAFSALALMRIAEMESSHHYWSSDEVVFLANHVDGQAAYDLGRSILEVLDPAAALQQDWDVCRPELLVLIEKMSERERRPLATTFAEFLSKDATPIRVAIPAYVSIAKYLDPNDAHAHSAEFAKRLGNCAAHSPFELRQIADLLKLLSDAQLGDFSISAKSAIDRLGAVAKDLETSAPTIDLRLGVSPFNYSDLDALSATLVSLEEFMTDDDATAITKSIARTGLQVLVNSLKSFVSSAELDREMADYGFDYRVETILRALEMVARLPQENVERSINRFRSASGIEKRWRLFQLMVLAVGQLTERRLAPDEAEALLQQAFESLFLDRQFLLDFVAAQTSHFGSDLVGAAQEGLRKLSEIVRPYLVEAGIPDLLPDPDLKNLRYWIMRCEQGFPFDGQGEVESFKSFVRSTTQSQQAELARAIVGVLIRTDEQRPETEEYFPNIVVPDLVLPPLGSMRERQPMRRPIAYRRIWELANAFAEVGGALDAEEAGTAARTILDQADHTDTPVDLAGLANMMISLAPKLSREVALQFIQRIALQFGTIADENLEISLLHAFRALATTLPIEDLVELLKWPNCVGFQRAILLVEIGRQQDKDFVTNWDFVAWAKESKPELYKTLKSPPRRPSDEVVRAGPRFEPPTQPEPAPTSPEPPPLPVPDR